MISVAGDAVTERSVLEMCETGEQGGLVAGLGMD